ncbi:GlxA family transcriptional regulator [Hahella ganghwensis]|uniref:GlxA family transcriptional regulator n=1 Tax=Hahella ganghwensis TaxID=286420 RepID=UPI00037D0CFC|nr:GlxA family transcriptional regulator [Hahella ganghwensis]
MTESQNPPLGPQKVAIILIPGFALTSFSLAVEALSVANLLGNAELYDYRIYAGTNNTTDLKAQGEVHSSNNVPVKTSGNFREIENADIICLCAYQNAPLHNDPHLFKILTKHYKQGSRLISLSSGSFLLARAGLLSGLSCTVTAEQASVFRELYPQIPLQENLYSISGRIFTCGGGATALDLMLYIIGKDYGRDFAFQVSERFQLDRVRSHEEIQASHKYLRLRMKSATLGAAIEIMENNIEHPYSIEQLANRIGSTTRRLEIAFRKHLNTSPNKYYLKLRLEFARKLIEETSLSMAAVAQAAGFTSQSYLARCFRQQFNVSPSSFRVSDRNV